MKARYRNGDTVNLSARLKQRITIERPVDVSDVSGGVDRTWQAVATVWAEITPQRLLDSERLLQERIQEQPRYRIVIRYRDDITTEMRVLWGSKTMEVLSAYDPGAANIALEMMAQEGVAV